MLSHNAPSLHCLRGVTHKQSFHRPAAGEALTRRKRPDALRRAHVGAAPAAPIRCASGQPQAGAELARPCASNTGAYSLRLPALLAVLYGAWSHSARTSLCYLSPSPFHPTASWRYGIVLTWVGSNRPEE